MQVDVTKENLCINQIVGQKSEIVVVEGDMIVPDIKPDILNTINTTGNVCIYKKEVLDGKIRLDGEINVYVMYLADTEKDSIRGLQTSIDFTEVLDFDECTPEMSLDEAVSIKNIECKILNGRKINIKASLQVEMSVYSNEDIEMVKEINNLRDVQSLQNSLKVNSLIGEGNAKTYAKDTIAIENVDELEEILNVDLSIVNKDIKISYNKVLGKAEVAVKILYLTSDNKIKKVYAKIPVMGFVDIENVEETNICDMKYKFKNVLIKPNSKEEHSIYVEIQMELYCRVYENKELTLIQDMYSPSECLAFDKRCINTMSNKNELKDVCNLREKISVPEISENEVYDVQVKPYIVNKKIAGSRIVYDGEVNLNFIYASNNASGIDVKQINLPFNFGVDIGENSNVNVETEIETANEDFIIGNNGSVDVKIDLDFILSLSNNIKIDVIDQVNIDETRGKEIYSMTIYFVKPGDTLWKIAKKFRSTVEDILRVNKIENEDKIAIGQQLFIPKYIYTRKEETA